MIRRGLCDDQFARVENLLPGRPGYVGRDSELGIRLFVDAVIWKFRTGVPWRDMPTRFGAWKNIHTRFSRWAIKGVWQSLFKTLADDPDNEYAMIDATIVRAHQHSAGARKKKGVNQAIGRSRGGLTTKIHMIVDALGNPLAFTLTAGQVHDITQAETLTSQVQPEALLADKGYDADAGAGNPTGDSSQGESQKQTRLRLRIVPRAQSSRTLLPIHQAIPWHRHPLRKNRAQFLGGVAAGVRAGLAQMRTRPSITALPSPRRNLRAEDKAGNCYGKKRRPRAAGRLITPRLTRVV